MRRFFVFVVGLLLLAPISSQNVYWIINSSQYSDIEPVSHNLLKVKMNGLSGLVDFDGNIVAECKYDTITAFANDRCLLLKNNHLKGIVNANNEVQLITDADYLVDPRYPYFSEGLLAVESEYLKKWGYISTNGNLEIGCRYSAAFPFSHGYASVNDPDNYYIHIDKSGTISKIQTGSGNYSFKSNDIVFASSFFMKGVTKVAVVIDNKANVFFRNENGDKVGTYGTTTGIENYQMKCSNGNTLFFDKKWRVIAIVDRNGNRDEYADTDDVEHYSVSTGLLSANMNDGMYDILYKDEQILTSQFEDVRIVSPDMAVVRKHGLYGMIKIDMSSRLNLSLDSDAYSIHHYTSIPMNISVDNEYLCGKNDVIMTVMENGNQVASSNIKNGVLSFKYEIPGGITQKVSDIKLSVLINDDDLVYAPFSITSKLSYSPSFIISVNSSVVLNEYNSANFQLSVTNNDNIDSDLCDVYFDGSKVMSAVIIKANRTLNIPIQKNIDIQDMDSISKTYTIEVRENSCPSFMCNKSILFERYFGN